MIRKINMVLALAVLGLYIASLIAEQIDFLFAYPLLAVMFILYGIESLQGGRRIMGIVYLSFSCFILVVLAGSVIGWI